MLIQNIKLTVDALIFTKGENPHLLLIKRKNEPFKNMWAFPGGFVDDDEDLEPAARRELEEETCLKVPSLKQLYTVGTPGRDPRGRTVSIIYYGFIEAVDNAVKGADDATEARWIPVKDIKELAFDHLEVLKFALQTLSAELNIPAVR